MGAADACERFEGQTLAGRFTLDRLVARGGSGVVYRGTHLALGCPVAVKVLAVSERDLHVSPQRFVEAFEREARTVAALRHPAVVRVFDSGVTELEGCAQPYVVFEWIEGETLEVHLRARAGQRRAPREALALLRPVFDAMACAHEAGVIHRDLKPSNVMIVAPAHNESAARVLDFGVAKVAHPDEALADASERTTDEFSSFTLTHAAPEQVGRLRTGAWTDVHALGLLLVEVLAGERAYRGATTVDLFARITSGERPTPRVFGLRVGPWEAELDRALSLDPRARHPHAGALLRALESTLDDAQRAWEEPAAHDASRRTPSRRRSTALSLIALAACIAFAAWRLAPTREPVRVDAPHIPENAPAPTVALLPVASAPVVAAPRVAPAVVTAPATPTARVQSAVRPARRARAPREPFERELAIE